MSQHCLISVTPKSVTLRVSGMALTHGLISSLRALIRWARNLNRFSGFVSPVLYKTFLLSPVRAEVCAQSAVPWHMNLLF